MRRLRSATGLLLALLLAGSAVHVRAQESGSIAGLVTDESGAIIPGVTVEVTRRDGSPVRRAVTDGTGRYRIDALAPGTWGVAFHLPNFASVVTDGVTVDVGTESSVDTTLRLRLTAQVLVTTPSTFRDLSTIVSESDLVGIANSATSGVVAGSQLEARPVQRPGDLVERVPGVIISQHSGEGKANQYYVRGFNIDHGTDLALSVAGLPGRGRQRRRRARRSPWCGSAGCASI